jgi:hypothetical protein
MTVSVLHRRDFLATLVTALGLAAPVRAQQLIRLGFRLKGLEDPAAPAVSGVLRTLADVGYRDLELDGLPPALPAGELLALRRLLDGAGLAAPARIVPMAFVFSNWRKALDDCRVLGTRVLVCDEVPVAQRASLDEYLRVARLLNAAGKITQWAGVQLAVRPHGDDLRPRSGVIPFEYLLAQTNAALVKFQMHLTAVTNAGRNPLDDLRRYPGRFVSVHMRTADDAAATEGPAPPPIDFAAVLTAARQAGVQYFFVDDDRADPTWARARSSFEYFVGLELK